MVYDTTRDHVTGESFSSEADVRDKSNAESPGRPYKCIHCTKRFSTPDNLKYHMARHTGNIWVLCIFHVPIVRLF